LKTVKLTKPPSAVTALSQRTDTRSAAREVAEMLRATIQVRPDLLVMFGSFHHRALFSDALETLRSELHPAHVLACTAESVIAGGREIERSAGLSAIALSLPGVIARPFSFELADGPPAVWSEGFIRERVSLPPDEGALPHRGVLMLADPFSIHAGQACAALDAAAGPQGARVFGGLASGASHAGLNVLAVDRRLTHEGIVGLSLFGDVEIDCVVSQGCRPVGPCFVVTKSRGAEILELGGRPALEAAKAMAETLSDGELPLLGQGLLVGIAYDATKPRLGRGDFLVRPVLAVDTARGALSLSDAVPVGTTVQFQIRDAATAHDDLALLLSAQKLRDPPAAALLFSCNARGSHLFGAADHDAGFISARLEQPPMAGFQCSGEIGPIGRHSYVHTQTASIALFRAPRPMPYR